MNTLTNGTIFGREPALILGFIQAAIVMLVCFGLNLDNAQQAAILATSTALLALLTRQSVVPNKTHVEEVQDALYKEVPEQPALVTEEAAA